MWEAEWTSGNLGAGMHTIELVHAGPSGSVVDIDAIEVIELDTTAPSVITLSAETGPLHGMVTLSWMAPGDDGTNGTASEYFIGYNTSEITDWGQAIPIEDGIPTPQEAGAAESMTVSDLIPGVTYYFAIRAEDEVSNPGELSNSPSAVAKNVPPPPNDDFGLATVISSFPFTDTVDVFSASAEPADPHIVNCNAIPDGYSVWYTFTPASSGVVTIDTLGSVFDTVLALWSGTTISNLQPVACNDDRDGNTFQSELSAPVNQGTQYYIEVDQRRAGPYSSPDESGLVAAPEFDKALVLNVTFTPPVQLGKYDDMDTSWSYTDFNSANSLNGPYDDTLHYSSLEGASAQIVFEGSQITLTYSEYSNRGNLEVYVDDVLVGTLNQYNVTKVWLAEWTSGYLGEGAHTVKFVHAGPSGTVVDIDAIDILQYQPPDTGKYDDMNADWNYTSFSLASSLSGPYAGTLHYSSLEGATAEFTFQGSQIILTYSKYSNRGNLEVYIDDVLVDTINQYNATRVWLSEWTSDDLGAGTHTVRFEHAGPSGTAVDIDAIEVRPYQPPPGVGKYDDMDAGWTFTSFNSASAVSGPYYNTLHFSVTVGASAEFTFEGSQITLTYSKYSNRGNLEVYVDDVLVDTINQYNATRVWLAEWTSGDLGAGVHTVKFVHAGPSGTFVDIDAIDVQQYQPPGIGIYDDMDFRLDLHELQFGEFLEWAVCRDLTLFKSRGSHC